MSDLTIDINDDFETKTNENEIICFDDDKNDEFYDDSNNAWDDDNESWGDIVDLNEEQTTKLPSPKVMIRQPSITEVDNETINNQRNKYITNLAEQLNIDDNKCFILLTKHKWNPAKIEQHWYNNAQQTLYNAGIWQGKPVKPMIDDNEIECGMCMDDVPLNDVYALDCGHQSICNGCWIDYLTKTVKSKECIQLTCPQYKCNVTVSSKVWKHFLDNNTYQNEYQRYIRFCRNNFIENHKQFSFCPGKNCDKVYINSSNDNIKTVTCKGCRHKFCWKCKNESHYPSDCDIANKWFMKCSSESENLQWILAKCKRCPKCNVHIEKNQGCNHMTCRKEAGGCGHEFCWLCKGDWKDHNDDTGGFYQCNIYEDNKAKGVVSDEEKASDDAKNELDRYEFHWTRYDSHYKSSLHAIKQRAAKEQNMHELAKKFKWNLNDGQFLLNAVDEVIHCWHVLSWTYPIAYYFKKGQNVELFKTYQAQLESFCDGLQEKLERDLDTFGDNKVRQDIVGYTRVAKQYRTNLIDYIEAEILF